MGVEKKVGGQSKKLHLDIAVRIRGAMILEYLKLPHSHTLLSFWLFKVLLHEAVFSATCNATPLRGKLQTKLHVQYPLSAACLATKNYTASCKKNRLVSQRCEIGCSRFCTCLEILSSSLRCKLQEKLPRVTLCLVSVYFSVYFLFLLALVKRCFSYWVW